MLKHRGALDSRDFDRIRICSVDLKSLAVETRQFLGTTSSDETRIISSVDAPMVAPLVLSPRLASTRIAISTYARDVAHDLPSNSDTLGGSLTDNKRLASMMDSEFGSR